MWGDHVRRVATGRQVGDHLLEAWRPMSKCELDRVPRRLGLVDWLGSLDGGWVGLALEVFALFEVVSGYPLTVLSAGCFRRARTGENRLP